MRIVPIPLSFGKTSVGDSVFHKIHMTFPMEKAVQIQTKVSCEEQKSLQPPFSALQRRTTAERTGGTFFFSFVPAEGRELLGPRPHTEFLPLRIGKKQRQTFTLTQRTVQHDPSLGPCHKLLIEALFLSSQT